MLAINVQEAPSRAQRPEKMPHFRSDFGLTQFLRRHQQLEEVPPAWEDGEVVLTGERWPLREVQASEVEVEMAYSKEPS